MDRVEDQIGDPHTVAQSEAKLSSAGTPYGELGRPLSAPTAVLPYPDDGIRRHDERSALEPRCERSVKVNERYLQRPMQIFGMGGLASFALGFGISAYLTYEKFAHGEALAARPLLLLGVLLIVVGLQLMSLGLVADVLARTYYESQRKPPYYMRRIVRSAMRDGEDTRPATPLRPVS
jgi:hypothetical protein